VEVSEVRNIEEVRAVIEGFQLQPTPMRVVVLENPTVTKVGLIHLPNTQQELISTDGFIIAVGEGVSLCKPGDRVYFGRYSGATAQIGDKGFRIMNEEDLLGVWKQ
jgi:co-chaperonin GroES (HSP10)